MLRSSRGSTPRPGFHTHSDPCVTRWHKAASTALVLAMLSVGGCPVEQVVDPNLTGDADGDGASPTAAAVETRDKTGELRPATLPEVELAEDAADAEAMPGPPDEDGIFDAGVVGAAVGGHTVELFLKPPAGVSDAELRFQVIDQPEQGSLRGPMGSGSSAATFTFTAPEGFVGDLTLTYSVDAPDGRTWLGIGLVRVHPAVYFSASPTRGSRDLTIEAWASTLGAEALPAGTYIWRFDDREEGGPLSSYRERQHTFRNGGLHYVSLTVVLAGMSTPIACKSDTGLERVPVTISPVIMGHIVDDSGAPVPDVRVVPSSDAEAVVTASDGSFVISVPYGWSGSLQAYDGEHAFEPEVRHLQPVYQDLEDAGFAGVPVPSDPLPPISPQPSPGQTVRISGTLRDHAGQPRASVLMRFRGTGSSTGTDFQAASGPNGAYAQDVPSGWSGVVSSNEDSLLRPASRSYVSVTTPRSTQDYTAHRNYWVAGNGRDAGLGLYTDPFRTIQYALAAAGPGDAIVVRAGTYDSNSGNSSTPVAWITRSGVQGFPITLRAADNERAILSGQNGVSQLLVLIEAAWIDVEGFELTGARRIALDVRDAVCHNVNVRRCTAHDNEHDRAFIGAAFRTYGPVRHVLFEECVAYNNGGGFQLRESPTQTAGSALVPPTAGNNGYPSGLPESQWDSWQGWTDVGARYVTIRRCLAYDNRLIDEHSDGFACRYANDCVFEDNIGFGNADDNFDFLGATRCIIRGNIAFDADPENTPDGDGNGIKIGVRGGLDNLVHHNIAFDNPRAGIDMADTERSKVYNNTCYNNGWFGIWFEGARARERGVEVANNIVYGNNGGGSNAEMGAVGGMTVTLADYDFFGDANNHNWAIQSGSHSIMSTDPRFIEPGRTISRLISPDASPVQKLQFYRDQVRAKLGLRSNSPAVDAGRTIQGITQNPLGDGPDMGAFESH